MAAPCSYQQVQNQQTTVLTSQPNAVAVVQPPQTFYRANGVKNLGITQIVFGCITVICGIVVLADLPTFWFSRSGVGIWTGILIIIAGGLCVTSGQNPEANGTRCAALTFCIICVVIAFISGIMAYISFISIISCSCNYNNCIWSCYRSTLSSIASIIMSGIMTIEFIIGIIAAIYTGRGCGTGYSTGGTVIIQQPTAGTIITSNASTVPYLPPYSAPGYQPCAPMAQPQPPMAQPQPPYTQTTQFLPPYSQAQPPYSQAAGAPAQTNVTYGSDYNQINKQAPPMYNAI